MDEEPKEDAIADDLGLLEKLKAWYKDAREYSGDWRNEAKNDYGMVAGDQWSAEDVAYLNEQNRPVITFNREGPILDAVCGMEVNNRQQVKYIPREVGDSKVNEILTGAADWVRDECDAEDEESDAFRDAATCGMGWTETRLSYDDDSDGKVLIERVDPLEMYWDRSARAKNITDRRYHCRVRNVDLAIAREMFPDVEDEDLHAAWASDSGVDDESPHINNGPEESYTNKNDLPVYASTKGKVKIVMFEWWEKEEVNLAIDPTTGESIEMDSEKFKTASERYSQISPGKTIQSTSVKRKVYKRAFVGNVVLKEDTPCKDHFTVQCITGKRDRNTNTWFGIAKTMHDPQRWANKWLSQVLHIMNSNAKGGVMVETDAVDNIGKFEATWADPASVTPVRPGAIKDGKIMPKPVANFPQGMDRLMEFAVGSIYQTTGVSTEFIGNVDREQAGIVEMQRQKATISTLAWLFDSMRRYRKLQGRTLLYFIQNYLPADKVVRIESQENAPYVPLALAKEVGKYDVIVDQAPTSPNNKELVWQMIIQMLPFLQKTPIPSEIWGELVTYSPLPTNLAQKINEYLKQPQGPSPEQQQAQAEMQQKQQEAQMDMAAKQADVQTKREMAAIDMQMAQQEMQLKAFEARLRQQELMVKTQVSMAQADKDMEVIRTETAGKAEVEGAKGKAQMSETKEMASQVAVAIAQAVSAAIGEQSMVIAEALSKPKRVIRGPDDKVLGVETVNG